MLSEQSLSCPYCGEPISILVDCSVEEQSYIEDCQVCCRPITLFVTVWDADAEGISIQAHHEDE